MFMPRTSTQFVCQQCGFSTSKWLGQCPGCGTWNSLVETSVSTSRTKNMQPHKGRLGDPHGKQTIVKLSEIKEEDYSKRTSTKIDELDRVLGGGVISGMVTLLAGEPGIGKSTLLLQLANNINGQIVYIAGEESASQVANRASRLGVKNKDVLILEETDVDQAISQISQIGQIGLIIIDSIQTLTTGDLTGGAGSIGQVRECAFRITEFCKRQNVPVFIVGHVNKEGAIAGPRVLEHMVDTVLWFEGDRSGLLRVIRAVKNRFGPTDEVGIFSMEGDGLKGIGNPSELFLSDTKGVSGSCTTAVIEGTRPILLEMQALVVPTKLAFPKRVASGIDARRLEVIVAVLSRRTGLSLWDYDIFVNAVGGLKVMSPASDLAIALAIASAYYDKALPEGTVGIGEVGLLGEIRPVAQIARSAKEAKRLGFKRLVTSQEARTVAEAINKFVSRSLK